MVGLKVETGATVLGRERGVRMGGNGGTDGKR